jgi:serine/threonine protein kinase
VVTPNSSIEKRKICPACNRKFTGTLPVCSHDGTFLIPDQPDLYIGTVLADKYQIISEVGRGGMSIVYKGRHALMDRTVAIKMLQAQLVSDQLSIKRFQQEAQAASCLAHPNVISVYDFGVSPNGQPYLVMDYLVGSSLSDIIRKDNHLEVSRALHIFIQACDALEHAHQKGVIHRDLKSSNIMLIEFEGKTDFVKVVDFGIAKLMPESGKQPQNLTQTGEIFGSPIYMSPEQCMGHILDARSDIYSMGAMVHEALTGQPPLMGDTIIDTMQMHVSVIPQSVEEVRPDLEFPPFLATIVLKALEKRAENRYQSMGEFADALRYVQQYEEYEGKTESQPSFEDRPQSTVPRTTSKGTSVSRLPRIEPPNLASSERQGRSQNTEPKSSRSKIESISLGPKQSHRLKAMSMAQQSGQYRTNGELVHTQLNFPLNPRYIPIVVISLVIIIVLALVMFGWHH